MKIRKSFVTNSSDASYVIIFKTPLRDKKEILMDFFQIDRLSLLISERANLHLKRYLGELREAGEDMWEVSEWISMCNWITDFPLHRYVEAIEEGKFPEHAELIQTMLCEQDTTTTRQYEDNKFVQEEVVDPDRDRMNELERLWDGDWDYDEDALTNFLEQLKQKLNNNNNSELSEDEE